MTNPATYPCDDCPIAKNCPTKKYCADYILWRWQDPEPKDETE